MNIRMLRTHSLLWIFTLMTVLIITGCGGNSLTFPASGRVTYKDGTPRADVTILFNGVPGAISDFIGNWTKTGLTGNVTVTAEKTGFVICRTIDPNNQQSVDQAEKLISPGNQTNIDFTAFDDDDLFDVDNPPPIMNRGDDDPSAAKGAGIEGVTLNCPQGPTPPATTGPSGTWALTNLVGIVPVTPVKDGWIFIPARIFLMQGQLAPSIAGFNKWYSGQQVSDMAATLIDNTIAPSDNIPIGGSTVSPAQAFYLMAKWLAIYGNTQQGTIPKNVPYMTLNKPASLETTGKKDCFMNWPDIISAGTAVASGLETTPTIDGGYTIKWASTGGGTTTDQSIGADDLFNVFARTINYTRTSEKNILPNYASVRDAAKPSDW